MNLHNHVQAIRCLPLLVILLTLTGCTHMINPPKTTYTGYTAHEKIPLKVAINVTDELRNAKGERHAMGDTWLIPIGKSLAENAPVLTRHVFADVVEIKNGSPPPNPVDAILTPKLAYINQTVGATSFGESIISIKVEWSFRDPAGEVIWVDTVTGQGSGSTGWTNPEEILKTAWSEVLRKSERGIWSSTAIRQFAVKKYPDFKIIDSTANITKTEVRELCATLQASDPNEVIRALKALRKLDAPEAVPEILPCLGHSHPNVVRDACRTLAVLGNKETIAPIEPLLKDKRSDVRNDAQDAIAKLRAKP